MTMETIQHSQHDAMQHDVNKNHETEIHRQEMDYIATAVSSSRQHVNPSDGPRSPEEKRLGISTRTLTVDDFEFLKTLGTGTFARVWLTRQRGSQIRHNNPVFALKILRKADIIKLKQVEHVRNERNTLSAVAGHPFITTLVTSFSDSECLYMLLDYCPGGEIFSYLRRARRFNEPTSRFYAAEITMTIEYLHDVQGVAYRDLKPENILLDADGHIKLVDFGFAKQVGNRETYTLCGTPEYLAPEVIHNSGHGLAVDWWALGILIYEFLVGQPPFWDRNPMRIYEQIVEGHVRYPPNMPLVARDIVSQLCRTNPTARLGYISGGATRVKAHPFFDEIVWDDLYYRRVKGPIIPRVDHPADAGNFEEYPPPPDPKTLDPYTDDMRRKYEPLFEKF